METPTIFLTEVNATKLCDILRLSRPTLSKLLALGLPSQDLGYERMFTLLDVFKWLAAHPKKDQRRDNMPPEEHRFKPKNTKRSSKVAKPESVAPQAIQVEDLIEEEVVEAMQQAVKIAPESAPTVTVEQSEVEDWPDEPEPSRPTPPTIKSAWPEALLGPRPKFDWEE